MAKYHIETDGGVYEVETEDAQPGQPAQGAAPQQQAAPQASPWAKPGPYITNLSPNDEQKFQSWVKTNNVPFDPSPNADYDMRGYWKQNQGQMAGTQVSAFDNQLHFPDTYKTPYHKTFSNQSKYATADAPHWDGDRLIAKDGTVVADETPQPATAQPAAQPPNPMSSLFAAPGQQAPAAPKAGLPADLPQKGLDAALSSLPYIGAIGGGLATGGLGFLPAVAGAMAFGTLGSGVEQGGRALTGIDAPQSFDEATTRMMNAGLKQGAYEATGYPVGKAIGGLVSRLEPEKLITKGLMASGADIEAPEAGNLAKTVLSEKIPIDKSAPGVVSDRLNGVRQQIGDLIAQNPQTIAPNDYVTAVQKELDAVRARVVNSAATNKQQILKAIDDAESGFLTSNAGPQAMPPQFGQAGAQAPTTVAQLRQQASRAISASDMQAMRTADSLDKTAPWRRAAGPKVAAQVDQAINSGLGNSLEAAYPGMAPLNARADQLTGLQSALTSVGEQSGPSYLKSLVKGVAPGGFGLLTHLLPHSPIITAGGAAYGLTSAAAKDPAVTSRVALALDAARKTLPDIPGTGSQYIKGLLTVPNVARAATPAVNSLMAEQPTGPVNLDMTNPFLPTQNDGGGLLTPKTPPASDNPFAPTAQPPKQQNRPVPTASVKQPTGWRDEWAQMLTDTANRFGLPAALMHVIAQNEGSGNFRSPTTVRSPAGAIGLMQVMPATGGQYGYSPKDLTDPAKNIDASAQLVQHLNSKYPGRPDWVLAAYNAGEGALKRAGYNISRLPAETQRYVQQGMARLRQFGLPG